MRFESDARARVEPWAKKWGGLGGVIMPDAHFLGESGELVAAYAARTGRPLGEVQDAALAAFREHVATWRAPQPLTPQLFCRKWEQVQAVMAGKVPAAKPREPSASQNGAAPARPKPPPAEEVVKAWEENER